MSKYNAKKTEYNGIVFDSAVECDYYKHLENKMNECVLQPNRTTTKVRVNS